MIRCLTEGLVNINTKTNGEGEENEIWRVRQEKWDNGGYSNVSYQHL